ncbi:MAG: helix-turn-helix transcriptional regulator [Cyanobacteria bacterium J06643_4]
MKIGSKYYPLFEHLQQQSKLDGSEQVRLTFGSIEQLIKRDLPSSAQKRAWWSNRDSTSALQAGAWVKAGYHVESVDFEKETVTFCKFQATYAVQRNGEDIIWEQQAIRALRKHMGMTQAKFAAELGVRRQTVSEWENGVYEPDRSTAKHLELIARQKSFDP